ncbi:Voltage-gated hydrogen channel 1 [Hondaea fermentalgiana]|uniref:Voltage-gated hydrogen channel 1 n=1 Tax=Hondaea fermentalgiana TaxID=2315210 RepID=A0A2R5G853_9STRA|nr:Voltage-gated hydrogen channel 1 [Hondaea fermentalgiana]|eukprot:GBG26499.1 Voltage-gated hydrogen channel 1 [Hondaea fermentalgiana]
MGRQVHWAPTKAFFLAYEEERKKVKAKFGKDSWNYRTLKFVHSHGVQSFLAALLALDVLVLIVELILTAYFPPCSVIIEQCVAINASDVEASTQDTAHRLLAEIPEASHSDGSEQCAAACAHQPHGVHGAHEALFWISVTILILFELELAVLLASIHRLFFRNALYIFDFVVVTVALVLETVLHTELAQEAGGLLIFVRLWRLLRVGHGIFTDVHEVDHNKMEKLRHEHKELIRENQSLRDHIISLGGRPPDAFEADETLSQADPFDTATPFQEDGSTSRDSQSTSVRDTSGSYGALAQT